MLIPNMGTTDTTTSQVSASAMIDVLFTPVQQRVLGLVFGQPQRRFQSAELIRLAGAGTGAAHRLLTRLASVGLLRTDSVGNQKFYQANERSPVFTELSSLMLKTVGLVEPLSVALKPLAADISAAFIFGSVARGVDRADSDIDLLIVTEQLDYARLYTALQPAEQALARPVNPIVMTRKQWQRKRSEPDSFTARIAQQTRLFVIGSDHDLE